MPESTSVPPTAPQSPVVTEIKPSDESTPVKVRLKFGGIEVDYEGPVSILRNDILPLLKQPIQRPQESMVGTGTTKPQTSQPSHHHLTITSVAKKLSCKSGSDLALAACAFLDIVQGKSEFTQFEIGEVMERATGYYKQNMRSNLTASLGTLEKNDKVNRISDKTFCLNLDTKNELIKQLA